MKTGDFAHCTRCNKTIGTKECEIRLVKKCKITRKGYCRNGWIVACPERECRVEKIYIRLYTPEELFTI